RSYHARSKTWRIVAAYHQHRLTFGTNPRSSSSAIFLVPRGRSRGGLAFGCGVRPKCAPLGASLGGTSGSWRARAACARTKAQRHAKDGEEGSTVRARQKNRGRLDSDAG